MQKRNLESLVVENGGSKVQNFVHTTTHIIAAKLDIRAQNILKKNDLDIYKPKWVTDSIKYKKLVPKSPFYLTYASKNTQVFFSNYYDCFGDSFFDEITLETLKEVFGNIKIDNAICAKNNQHDSIIIANIDNKKEIKNEENSMITNEEYSRALNELISEYPNCDWLLNFTH